MSPSRRAALEAEKTLPLLVGSGEHATVLDWAAFVPPPEAITRHGIWMLDDLADALRSVPTPGYREWFG